MPIYLGNTEIGKELVGTYPLGKMYLGANQVNDGDNGSIFSSTLIGNFNTWDTTSYPGSGSTWTNLDVGGGNINLVNSPTFTQEGGYFPTNYFTMTTSSYGSGSLTGISAPDNIFIQAWVYTPGINDALGLIHLGNPTSTADDYFGIGIRTNGDMGIYFNNTLFSYTATNTLNQWVNIAAFIVGVTTTSTVQAYVNGVSVGSNTFSPRKFYQGNNNIVVGSSGGTFKVGQVLVSNNIADIANDTRVYQNYYATKQYFGY
jgi:hypothetical protein